MQKSAIPENSEHEIFKFALEFNSFSKISFIPQHKLQLGGKHYTSFLLLYQINSFLKSHQLTPGDGYKMKYAHVRAHFTLVYNVIAFSIHFPYHIVTKFLHTSPQTANTLIRCTIALHRWKENLPCHNFLVINKDLGQLKSRQHLKHHHFP